MITLAPLLKYISGYTVQVTVSHTYVVHIHYISTYKINILIVELGQLVKNISSNNINHIIIIFLSKNF